MGYLYLFGILLAGFICGFVAGLCYETKRNEKEN